MSALMYILICKYQKISENFGTLLKNQLKIEILVIPTTTFENVPLLRGFDPRRRQIFFLIFPILFNFKRFFEVLEMRYGKDNDDIKVFNQLTGNSNKF